MERTLKVRKPSEIATQNVLIKLTYFEVGIKTGSSNAKPIFDFLPLTHPSREVIAYWQSWVYQQFICWFSVVMCKRWSSSIDSSGLRTRQSRDTKSDNTEGNWVTRILQTETKLRDFRLTQATIRVFWDATRAAYQRTGILKWKSPNLPPSTTITGHCNTWTNYSVMKAVWSYYYFHYCSFTLSFPRLNCTVKWPDFH